MLNDEKDLLEGLREGKDAAYQEIFRRYGPMLLGYAIRLVGNRDDGEEVVQEALVSIFDHIERFEGRCSIRSWLFRIVHHKAVDHLRRNSRFVRGEENEDGSSRFTEKGMWKDEPFVWENSLEARVDARKMLQVVRSQIDELPHNYREILLLREVYQLDTPEICNILEITPVHTRVMLHRARQALYKAVEKRLKQNQATV